MTDPASSTLLSNQASLSLDTRRGRTVCIRHIVPEDAALLVDLFKALSPETRRLRFFQPITNLPEEYIWTEARRLSAIDPLDEAALIATVAEAGAERAVGVARLIREPADPPAAEVAIVLRDDYQGEGLGGFLFDLLLQVAMVRGFKRLSALSLAENRALHQLIRKAGLPFTSHTSTGETTTTITLSDS